MTIILTIDVLTRLIARLSKQKEGQEHELEALRRHGHEVSERLVQTNAALESAHEQMAVALAAEGAPATGAPSLSPPSQPGYGFDEMGKAAWNEAERILSVRREKCKTNGCPLEPNDSGWCGAHDPRRGA